MRKLVKRLLYPVIIIERLVDAGRRMLPTRDDFRSLLSCLKHHSNKFYCMRRSWKKLPSKPRHFLGNMAVGLAIALFLHAFHNIALLSEIEDTAVDWMVGIYKGTVSDDRSIPLGWVDIDDKTYEQWQAPLYIPRDRLAQLMCFVLRSDPKMLLIDVDLAARGHGKEFDRPVINLIKEYNNHCNEKPLLSDPDCPPIIFAASLRRSDTDQVIQRKSHIDELVDQSGHLFWASPSFDRDTDGMTRRWRLWDAVCRDDQPVALPSFQLLAANLLTNDTERAYQNLSCLNSFLPKTCTRVPDHKFKISCDFLLWSKKIGKEDQRMELTLDGMARRIRYTVPWKANIDRIGGSPTMIPGVMTYEYQERPLISWMPAYAVPANPNHKCLFADNSLQHSNALNNRAVFIGGSFGEGRDSHNTPLGEMPGVLIIINALHSLLQHSELKQIEWYWFGLIETGLIFVISFLFTIWNAFLAKVTSTVTVIVLLLPLSVICFGYGLWLDFALPLLGVSIHEFIADIEETRAEHRSIASVGSTGKKSE